MYILSYYINAFKRKTTANYAPKGIFGLMLSFVLSFPSLGQDCLSEDHHINHAQNYEDSIKISLQYFNIGDCWLENGEINKAGESYYLGILCSPIDDSIAKKKYSYSISRWMYSQQHDSLESYLLYARKALSENQDTLRLFFTYSRLINMYQMSGKISQAIQQAQTGLPYAQSPLYKNWLPIMNHYLGTLYFQIGEWNKSVKFYLKAEAEYQLQDDEENYARVKRDLAITYASAGRYADALSSLDSCVKLFTYLKDRSMVGLSILSIANVYQELELYPIAQGIYHDVITDFDSPEYNLIRARAYNNLGVCHLGNQILDSANFCFSQALQLFEALGIKNEELRVRYNLLQTIQKNDINQYIWLAEDLYEIKYMPLLFKVQVDIGRWFLKLDQVEASRDWLFRDVEFISKNSGSLLSREWSLALAEYSLRTGNEREHELWLAIAQQTMNTNQSGLYSQIAESLLVIEESKYKRRKEKELASYQEEILALAEGMQDANSRIILQKLGLIILSILIIASTILSIRYRKEVIRRKKKNELLQQEINYIDNLARENSHRVKNNMMTLASLFSSQARQVSSVEIKQYLIQAYNRINAMILLYQKMHQEKSLSKKIELTSYLTSLIDDLLFSYGVQKDICKIHIEQCYIIADSAIAISLIINELITNAVKYAIPNNPKPKLEIVLKMERHNSRIILTVTDNGPGFPKDFFLEKATTFGLRFISLLTTNQLDGGITLFNKSGVQIVIPFTKLGII